MKKGWLVALLLCGGVLQHAVSAPLPQLGTKFKPLPKGDGRKTVEAACLPCHSSDMLSQQRLTEKQWTAEVDKMIRWGAVVADAAMDLLAVDELEICPWALREGVILRRLDQLA